MALCLLSDASGAVRGQAMTSRFLLPNGVPFCVSMASMPNAFGIVLSPGTPGTPGKFAVTSFYGASQCCRHGTAQPGSRS